MQRELEAAAQVMAHHKAEGTHWVAPGLYLQIKPNGARSWLLRYGKGGKTFWHGLGAAREVPLKEARERAEELRVDIRRRGAHPVVERRDQRTEAKAVAVAETSSAAPSFRWCADQVIRQREKSHKSDYAQRQWPSSMRDHVYPHIGDLAVDRVGLHEVHKVLSRIWQKQFPTAKKVRGRIATIWIGQRRRAIAPMRIHAGRTARSTSCCLLSGTARSTTHRCPIRNCPMWWRSSKAWNPSVRRPSCSRC